MRYATLLLFCLTAYSQNPDGNGLSIHISPFLNGGTSDISTISFTPRYTASGSFIAYTKTQSSFSIGHNKEINVDVLAKYPVSNSITISLFYRSNVSSISMEQPPDTKNISFSTISKISAYSFGGTFSVYLSP